jgi:hypothetical protein
VELLVALEAELRGGHDLLLLVLSWWLAQLPERGEHRCFSIRSVSKGAK